MRMTRISIGGIEETTKIEHCSRRQKMASYVAFKSLKIIGIRKARKRKGVSQMRSVGK